MLLPIPLIALCGPFSKSACPLQRGQFLDPSSGGHYATGRVFEIAFRYDDGLPFGSAGQLRFRSVVIHSDDKFTRSFGKDIEREFCTVRGCSLRIIKLVRHAAQSCGP